MGKVGRRGAFFLHVLFTAAGICCLLRGMQEWENIKILHRNVNLLMQEEKITQDMVQKIREQEAEDDMPTEFTVWTMEGNGEIFDEKGYHRAKAQVIALNGSSELLVCSGSVLHAEDKEGCLIGRETAGELFGTTKVKGKKVKYEDRTLTVRGILWEVAHILLVQAKEDAEFERLTLQGKSGVTKSMQAERFCMNHGINAGLMRTEIFTGDLLRELVPSAWADFEGWKSNIHHFSDEVGLFLDCEKSPIERCYLSVRNRGTLFFICGTMICFACLIWGIKMLRRNYSACGFIVTEYGH